VSVQQLDFGKSPGSFGSKEGMDILVMENVFYCKNILRIFDLKGSQRDRYAQAPAIAGTVLLDENLREINATSPTLVGPDSFVRLQNALAADSDWLANVGNIMDYSLILGLDADTGELVVGMVDYIRSYTWDKQIESWVKTQSGILGGAGDPTVISPLQYSARFRTAMATYFTVVPGILPPRQA
jgi:1-phosphatidylinositol-3-phosphate 5-kinase